MAMHSGIYGLVAASDKLTSCEECGYYLTATDAGLVCTRCPKVETEAEEVSTQDRVREALSKAGHGAVATDSFGGEGLIGYHTFPMLDNAGVYVGFCAEVGQSFRFPAEVMAGLTRPMLERYASTLRDAGFCVAEADGLLRVTDPAGIASENDDEPTAEQSAALTAYIAAREEVEGLRDDIYFANSFAEKDEASAKLGAARSAYAQATREATRLGVIEVGRRMFR